MRGLFPEIHFFLRGTPELVQNHSQIQYSLCACSQLQNAGGFAEQSDIICHDFFDIWPLNLDYNCFAAFESCLVYLCDRGGTEGSRIDCGELVGSETVFGKLLR